MENNGINQAITQRCLTRADGSIYIAVTTRGDLDGQVNNGGEDAFAKNSEDGEKQWTNLLFFLK